MDKIQYAVKTPIGPLYAVVTARGLSGLHFKKQDVKSITRIGSANLEEKQLKKIVSQLEEYFEGKRMKFDMDFDFSGTSFQKHVWKELYKIPYGQTVSYKDIAKRIKNPKAVRAVGSANGKNPICVVIPCHRVIAADGSIGGYSGGISIKRRLLKYEKNNPLLGKESGDE